MAACICDEVRLWGGRIGSEVNHGDCWICKYVVVLGPELNFNRASLNGSDATAESSVNGFHVTPKAKSSSNSPASIRERRRIEMYRRESDKLKAQRDIKVFIQNKRRNDFASLREALYLVYTYRGPFLQKPGDKKKAAQYLRRMGFGAMFVNITEHEVKWKWLEGKVKAIDERSTCAL
ncbi:hypothetical protein DFH28DRAFT_1086049 [Melampsora americana]|nr:hypothetical protein DFH28DRAFT_1086049 [Melampsora americana]